MTTANTTTNVAATIARQLGGTGRISAMVGAFNMLDHGDAFSFRFKGSRALNYCKIELDAATDTYTVTFGKVRRYELTAVQTFPMVYAAQLRGLFESTTGLYLSLGTCAA